MTSLSVSSLENFKKELYDSYFYEEGPEIENFEKFYKLIGFMPQDLSEDDFVELIFDHPWAEQVSLILEMFLSKNPNYSFSPFNQIRRSILEDGKHLYSNDWLSEKLREVNADQRMADSCYELAFKANHPNIYPLATKEVRSSDYSLNFLWVNLNPQDRSQNLDETLFGNNEKEYLTVLEKWAELNQGCKIHLWYDSALITRKVQQRMFDILSAISAEKQVDMRLKDVRKLPNIPNEILLSLHPGTPLFYRIDILKALISDYLISSLEEEMYSVICDFDIKPMTKNHLFDRRTIKFLNSHSYVFNSSGSLGYENSFFIFKRGDEKLRANHQKKIIKNIEALISSKRKESINEQIKSEFVLGSQAVYRRYDGFLESMDEQFGENLPRKVVECPLSKFESTVNFPKSSPLMEIFQFKGRSNIPITRFGRCWNGRFDRARVVPGLENWVCEPLEEIEKKAL